MKKVLILEPSLRKESFNKKLALYISEKLRDLDYKVTDFHMESLPYMNQDIEFPVPLQVQEIRDKVDEAVAVWIVTPEYNGDMPAVLKNALDWISRPTEMGGGRPAFIKDKPVFITGLAGRSEAMFSRERVVFLTKRITMKPMEPQVGIGLEASAFSENNYSIREEDKAKLDEQIEAFHNFAKEI